ncbi:MAG: dTDP-4-dehydrorhamnose 3,5-epimerase family protein, partial [Actinomycetia bacterium]|nr:dTDP-4-dehydrorhamnose 3,5-epimerase family protein [Actinomycetes bacterium]
MQVTWTELAVPGLMLSSGASLRDERGTFTKVLSGDDPLVSDFGGREIYWTQSAQGVLRGMHFQLPPEATSKLVFVVS